MKQLGIILGVVVLIAAYFFFQIDWEARAIRGQFDQLVELVEKDGPVSQFEALGRSRKLVGLFTEQPTIEYFPNRRLSRGADAIGAAFLSAWSELDTASIYLLGHELEVDDDSVSARSKITLRASIRMEGVEKMGDTLRYRVYWQKVDGTWRIRDLIALES